MGAGTEVEVDLPRGSRSGRTPAPFREGLAMLLEQAGQEVVGRAADTPSLLADAAEHAPDLAVIDVRMPPGPTDDGTRAARELRRREPSRGSALVSQHVETRRSVDLVSSGRSGCSLEHRARDVDDLLDALRRVAAGGSSPGPEVVGRSSDGGHERSPESPAPREREVIALMAEGSIDAGTAQRLWPTEQTVEGHVASILPRLGLVPTDDDHRRVPAVVAHLGHAAAWR